MDELLSVRDVMDAWGVTKSFIKQHTGYEGHPPRTLPELSAVVDRGRLFFEPTAVRAFFRAFNELHRPIRLKRGAAEHAARLGTP